MRQPSRPSEEDKGANDDVLSRASISRSLGTPGTMQADAGGVERPARHLAVGDGVVALQEGGLLRPPLREPVPFCAVAIVSTTYVLGGAERGAWHMVQVPTAAGSGCPCWAFPPTVVAAPRKKGDASGSRGESRRGRGSPEYIPRPSPRLWSSGAAGMRGMRPRSRPRRSRQKFPRADVGGRWKPGMEAVR